MKLTMTLKECTSAMRSAGIRTSETTIANCIEHGIFPFGKCIGCGKTGRRQIFIQRDAFENWLCTVTNTERKE